VNLRLPLRIEKEQVAYFNAGGSAEYRPGRMPIFIHWRTESVYGFPDLGNGVKTGFHHAGTYIDHPDQHDFQPNASDLSRMSRYIGDNMPGLAPEPLAPVTCLYTNTPDEDFIIDALPSAPNVIIGSPCSGHGFKFAVGVGRALADLAVLGETDMSISHVRKLRDKVYR
jgi:sarcosine oxidase